MLSINPHIHVSHDQSVSGASSRLASRSSLGARLIDCSVVTRIYMLVYSPLVIPRLLSVLCSARLALLGLRTNGRILNSLLAVVP